MLTRKPCAAGNCNCEDFLTPKLGIPKKSADTECNHPFSVHQSLVSLSSKKQQASAQNIIRLNEVEEVVDDIQVLRKPISHSFLVTTNYPIQETTS